LLYTGSTSGIQASAYSPVYTSLKHGVVGFAKGVAKRYAKEGIRANVICPGPIDTPMLREFVNRPDAGGDVSQTENLVKERAAATPLGRAGQPEEIANAALFLLSDEASFITGATLLVDGGISA
jgi:NAD(P)-dependent dehydrogenase (short-subunit alcohol dehydrogenase family)